MELLPPYSPDYNPIEYSFSVIKSALKGRHQISGDENFEELCKKIKVAVAERITPDVARSQFRHCRILV